MMKSKMKTAKRIYPTGTYLKESERAISIARL